MTINTTGYEGPQDIVNDLNHNYPTNTGPISQGDDHIRLIKSTLKTQFPNFTGPSLESSDDIELIHEGLEVIEHVEGDFSTGKFRFNPDQFLEGSETLPDGRSMFFSTTLYGGEQTITGSIDCVEEAAVSSAEFTSYLDITGLIGDSPPGTLLDRLESYHLFYEALESEIAELESRLSELMRS